MALFTEGARSLGRAWLACSGVLIPAPVGQSEDADRWLVLPAQQASVSISFSRISFNTHKVTQFLQEKSILWK